MGDSLVCAMPTKRFPEGRTGTTAGYAAHRKLNEMACEACVAAWTAKCAERTQALSPEVRKREKQMRLASGRRTRAAKRTAAALADACNEGLRGTAAGYNAHIAAGQRPCKPCNQSPAEPGAACARPTLRFPAGRSGTSAGYQAHQDAGESACRACTTAQTAKSNARRAALSEDELAQYRKKTTEAYNQWRKRNPDRARAAKHRVIARSRAIVQQAKDKPCSDCGVRYPYYVMEFDHLDSEAKEFNVSAGVTRASFKRLVAEIAKCDVVCANCHAERTHQRKQAQAREELSA